jgi:7-cyano-7-deazaguanine reductase
MKSLKLYFLAYRDKGIFYEGVVNTILDDLVAVLAPRSMQVVGQFAVRGGTAGTVTARHDGRSGGRKNGQARAGANGRARRVGG